MTVLEVVKAYHLEDFDKSYKNLYGDCVGLAFSLDVLCKMEVRDIYINIRTNRADITLNTFES